MTDPFAEDMDIDIEEMEKRQDDEERKAEAIRKEIVSAFKAVFLSRDGERVLQHLRELYNDETTFVPGDPYASAYNEGCRAVYLQILKTIDKVA